MDFDGLVTSMRHTSNDPVVLRLCELLAQWKNSDSNVHELESLVEHYIGNTWIANDTDHKEIYRLWSEFRDDAVRGIHGMTMNERLFCFSLLPRFDSANTDQQRKALYAKLLANP